MHWASVPELDYALYKSYKEMEVKEGISLPTVDTDEPSEEGKKLLITLLKFLFLSPFDIFKKKYLHKSA